MFRFVHYAGQYQGIRGNFGELPAWARLVVTIAALPGVVLLALSIVAIGVSILALLLLVVPVYTLLRMLTGPRVIRDREVTVNVGEPSESPGRRQVDAKVIE